MEVWTGAGAETAAPSVIIDLGDQEGEGKGAAEVASLTLHGTPEGTVPAVGGGEVAADVVGREVRGGRADADRGSGGKGEEIGAAEGGLKAGGDSEAASAGADAVVGCSIKGKGRADNGSARTRRGSSRGGSSGGGSGGRQLLGVLKWLRQQKRSGRAERKGQR